MKPILLKEWELPVFPPSLNHQTQTFGKLRFDSPEYKQFKKDCSVVLQQMDLSQYQDSPLSLVVHYHWSGWWTKAGVLKKRLDCSNRYKAIEDAIFDAIGICDSRNVGPAGWKAKPQEGKDKYITAELYVLEGY